MSLRDQLLKAGLASKKDLQKAERALKKERRLQQGSAKKKKKAETEARKAAEREREAELEAKQRARRDASEAREAHEHRYRVRQVIEANRLGGRGKFAFRFKVDRAIKTLHVNPKVAEQLRRGEAAIAWLDEESFHVIGVRGAKKLLEIEPERVVHYVQSTQGLAQADERLAPEDPEWWIPDLRARRATPADVAAYLERVRSSTQD